MPSHIKSITILFNVIFIGKKMNCEASFLVQDLKQATKSFHATNLRSVSWRGTKGWNRCSYLRSKCIERVRNMSVKVKNYRIRPN